MRLYLAARLARHPEMRRHAATLAGAGHVVTSRWIAGGHEAGDILGEEELCDAEVALGLRNTLDMTAHTYRRFEGRLAASLRAAWADLTQVRRRQEITLGALEGALDDLLAPEPEASAGAAHHLSRACLRLARAIDAARGEPEPVVDPREGWMAGRTTPGTPTPEARC